MVALCLSPGPAHLAGLEGLCAKNVRPKSQTSCHLSGCAVTWSSPKCLLLPTIHTCILWKNPLPHPLQAAMAFYGSAWDGGGGSPGLRNGKFQLHFSLQVGLRQGRERAESQGDGDGGSEVSPHSAPDQLGAVRTLGGVSVLWPICFLLLPNIPRGPQPTCLP